ncbi:tRNA delta(2)-isopentenylpyrophosphate transferase [Lactococcus lactis subsp. lactis IO-1]|nr:tRNA delta(2)-isopentenylpyrophosphate transferase [Lactococcus lactis subsp. lactis IO-1]
MTCSGHCVYFRDKLMQTRGIEPFTSNRHHYGDFSFTKFRDLYSQSAHSLASHADSIDIAQ